MPPGMMRARGGRVGKPKPGPHDMQPKPNLYGETQHPPVIVYDMDDDIEQVSPLNPKFAELGTRDADGRLLDPCSELGIKFDGRLDIDDQPVYLWRHNQDTPHGRFDSGRNVVNHAQVRKMAATAHAMTVTGPELAEVARRWNPRVYVYPNSIMFDDFHAFDIKRRPDEVRVLWQGGYSHFPDFYPLRHAFGEAARRMPQIKWVVFGTLFGWVYENIPQFRVEFHPWVAHEMFHIKYGTLAFDINIAPLVDNQFNRCKSGIKMYEAAALKVPTLAQAAGPYKHEIIDGETGLLFSTPQEFVEKLDRLVRDPDYRVKLGQAAHDWVRAERDALKTVIPLANFYRDLIFEVQGRRLAA